MILGVALAVMIGLSLGLMGGGGSILTVPVLVYVLGFGAKESIAMSLAVVGTASLVGSVSQWRAGNVNLRVALPFGVFAMAGAFLGAKLAAFLDGPVQLTLFSGVMLTAAVRMFRQRDGVLVQGERTAPRPLPLLATAIVGVGVGILTGLVGVGGGFLIVPALVLLASMPMKQAVGTSLLVIAMNSVSGLAGYLGQVEVDWAFVGLFTAASIVGILLGTWLLRFVPQHALQRAFAVFLVVMGSFILDQNRGVVIHAAQALSIRTPIAAH